MKDNNELQDKVKYLQTRIAWLTTVANDAGNNNLFDIAKYLRNAIQISKSELYGIEQAIKSFE
jgi:hypothetical protein